MARPDALDDPAYPTLASLPLVSLALGRRGALAIVVAAALISRAGGPIAEAIRTCGQRSIVIYLAFSLPMAATREILVRTGVIADIGLASLIVMMAAVLLPLAAGAAGSRYAAELLFVRPRALPARCDRAAPALRTGPAGDLTRRASALEGHPIRRLRRHATAAGRGYASSVRRSGKRSGTAERPRPRSGRPSSVASQTRQPTSPQASRRVPNVKAFLRKAPRRSSVIGLSLDRPDPRSRDPATADHAGRRLTGLIRQTDCC